MAGEVGGCRSAGLVAVATDCMPSRLPEKNEVTAGLANRLRRREAPDNESRDGSIPSQPLRPSPGGDEGSRPASKSGGDYHRTPPRLSKPEDARPADALTPGGDGAGMPSPGATDDAVEGRHARAPAQPLACPAGIGDEHRGIAGTACHLPLGHRPAGQAPGRADHLAHAVPGAGTEIEGQARAPFAHMTARRDMRLGQILDVDAA